MADPLSEARLDEIERYAAHIGPWVKTAADMEDLRDERVRLLHKDISELVAEIRRQANGLDVVLAVADRLEVAAIVCRATGRYDQAGVIEATFMSIRAAVVVEDGDTQ